MSTMIYNILAVVLSVTILYGIHLMDSPKTAVRGNQIGAVSMAIAILVTLLKDGTLSMPALWIAMAIGSFLGLYISVKVKMIQMPQYVALLNGFGGAASALVALMVLVDSGAPDLFSKSTAGLALLVGIITLTGSLVAAGKLHQVLAQKPVELKNHSLLCNGCVGVMLLGLIALTCSSSQTPVLLSLVLLVLGGGFGVLFTIRVGGADMPVTISLLNSLSGVAGAIAGLAIADPLLVAVGGIVGASGLLLTQIMCRAMNRSLMDILLGKTSVSTQSAPKTQTPTAAAAVQGKAAALSPAEIVRAAKKVIIIPGYGMALAQAQHRVKSLAEALQANGATVDYAVHPVAGRMPGHMNVLLAEAGVDYEKLLEMDDANPLFPETDLAIIVGANDVINPAAREAEGTPIYGMPILDASKAKHIIICNFDLKPGYAGVANPLYVRDDVTMLLGDANDSVDKITAYLHGAEASGTATPDATSAAVSPDAALHSLLHTAKKVIIIPGYGMALAQAQHKVKALAESFEAKGVQVDYAVHPVAGRMPGHMNVLLAEAGVDYEKLLEMDAANPLFADTDLAIIVGANDVVNPAAREAEGTPIYGMPILDAGNAKNSIICNFDLKPGYAGVDNPLYTRDNVTMLLGDANDSVDKLITLLQNESIESPAATSVGAKSLPALLHEAKKVIIIPGYGMALAQAQHKVKALAESFEAKGVQVDYAVHPVAGRMPGHMNVLLAEAGVDYEKLLEMDAANPLFADTDLVIIVGANDVVNPAAREAEGTPIYGMPILDAGNAKNSIICNFDLKPGYAGVDNPLYTRDNVTMLLGDANNTVDQLIAALAEPVASACTCGCAAHSAPTAASQEDQIASLLASAKKVMLIPGYGMALAQAQHKVKSLADKLEAKGVQVDYAIHPVAGRMPGHMNVLLAEADVDYEKLLEMDAVNPLFASTDVAIVVGANDVINPAAIVAEGTPIYGMPILRVDEAKHIIICNYDLKPGYAGVDNPLYTRSDVIMLQGDANDTVAKLIHALEV